MTKCVCPICGKEVANKGLLAQHMESPAHGSRAAHNLAQGLLPSGRRKKKPKRKGEEILRGWR